MVSIWDLTTNPVHDPIYWLRFAGTSHFHKNVTITKSTKKIAQEANFPKKISAKYWMLTVRIIAPRSTKPRHPLVRISKDAESIKRIHIIISSRSFISED
jgi:hypothetical protein